MSANGFVARPGQVKCSIIHMFKGLKANAVALTDLDGTKLVASFDPVLEVGITCATDRFVALFETNIFRQSIGGAV